MRKSVQLKRKAKKSKAPSLVDKEQIAATVAVLDRLSPKTAKGARIIAMLKSWLLDESGYDEETWPQLKKSLDLERKRVGARRLFDD